MEADRDPLRKIPTKHAPDVKVDIGGPLKAARQKKGHSVEAVCQHTRIPKKFIDALEANRFDEFPAMAYLRGFLKSYCDYLETDFEPLWKLIVADSAAAASPAAASSAKPAAKSAAAASAPVATAPAPAAPPKAAAPKPSKPAPEKAPTHTEDEPTSHAARPAHAPHGAAHAAAPAPAASGHDAAPKAAPSSTAVTALLLGGIAAALFGAYWLSPSKPAPAPAETAVPPAALAPMKSQDSQIQLLFRQEMWVSITVDGAEKFQGRVPQGTKQDWKIKKSLALRASDPQSLSLTFNGAPAPLPAPAADGTFRLDAQAP